MRGSQLNEQQRLIELHGLVPHPEGGFYAEVHRANLRVLSGSEGYERSAYTSIYYLLGGEDFSSWHRIQSDETWFFHSGCDLAIYSFAENGQLHVQRLGAESGRFQLTIPAKTWFAAQPCQAASCSFVSCVVSPGFEFQDFELGSRQSLLAAYGHHPEHQAKIEAFTRERG
jgi:predicted cupin superfamily sugar epimerase